MVDYTRIKNKIIYPTLISILIISMGFTSIGCTCDCGDCSGCGCTEEPEDTESDGDEISEDWEDNVDEQPDPPVSICANLPPTTEITISGTKSATATYNTYTYSYNIKACNGNVAYDIYLKGVRRLTADSGSVVNEKTKSGSKSITSPYDFSSICIYTPTEGEKCVDLA